MKYISPLLLWCFIAFGVVLLFVIFSRGRIFSLGAWGWVFVGACAVYFVITFIRALLVHRNAVHSIAGIDHLVTEGAYQRSRHPLYGADIVMAWGVMVLIGSSAALAMALWCTAVFFGWAKLEEWGLEKKFGKEYTDYKVKTPMFFPHFWE